jgi:chemotaxis family two-component system response regulator Rcp1
MNRPALEVVLIEDNSADIFLIGRALKEAGLTFNLRTFKDGESAMSFVENMAGAEAATPDLFVMDWNLPRVHGRELLAAIGHCDRLLKTPRIVLTSSESPADREMVERLGGVFVSKPRNLEEFLQIGRRIKTLLGTQ